MYTGHARTYRTQPHEASRLSKTTLPMYLGTLYIYTPDMKSDQEPPSSIYLFIEITYTVPPPCAAAYMITYLPYM